MCYCLDNAQAKPKYRVGFTDGELFQRGGFTECPNKRLVEEVPLVFKCDCFLCTW